MSPCSSIEQLEQFLAGGLAEPVATVLREHLARCATCQSALDRLSDQPQLRPWSSSYRSAGDQQTHAWELSRLLYQLRETPIPQSTPAPSESAVGITGEPEDGEMFRGYRILGELGRGGMGVVLKAHDPQLERVVALKVLRADRTDGAARERFVREARAAAGVEQDHVVPVYSVSNPADGPPYLVMQYVAGPTIRERIKAEQRLDPREAAELAAQIADGLAAAHRAGLIHRDIKPGNVIVEDLNAKTPSAVKCRAKIMDFGLVRVKEQPGGITREGLLAGTPEYMSPEQIRAPEQIDERSDVYGLGVTLYEMLTGEVPFRGTPHMVLQQVLRDDPDPPRRLNDAVPRDLETICLKAMTKEPERRYGSAAELRDDLRRWLAGEPIRARPISRPEKLWRWCRRKPALAAVSAALIIVFVGGLAGVLSQWQRAETSFQDADQQRTSAEESLRRALETVDQFCTAVSQDLLLNEPGMQPLRRRLLETARDYYQKFVQERGDNPRLQSELAKAQLRLAQVVGEIGSAEEAIELTRGAANLFDELAAQHPDVPDHAGDRAMTYNALGILYQSGKRLPEARIALETALAIQEAVVGRHPEVTAYQNRLALILDNVGLLHSDMKDFQKAEPAYDRALRIWGRLARDDRNAAYDESRAMVQEHLAQLHRAFGRTKRQEEALQSALGLRRQLLQAQPASPRYRADLARSHELLGAYYQEHKRTTDGETAFKQAIDAWKHLADDNPRVTRYQRDLAGAHNALGYLYQRAGQPTDAETTHKKAQEIRARLAREHPRHADFQAELARSHLNLGVVYLHSDRMPEAETDFGTALAILKPLVAEYAHVPAFHDELAKAHNNLGLVHRANKRLDLAFDELRIALGIWERLAREHKAVSDYAESTARTSYNVALWHKDQDQFDDAEKGFRDALAIFERLVREQPTRTELVTALVRTRLNLTHVLRETGKLEAALLEYIPTEQSVRLILRDDARNAGAMEALRNVHWGRAQTLELMDRWQEALPEWDRALEMELQIKPVRYREQVCLLRARTRAHLRRHVEAAREADELVGKGSLSPESLIASAKVYAAAAAATRRDESLPGAERERQAEAYAARAVEAIAKAHAAGYFKNPAQAARMERDPDLKLLLERQDLRTLLDERERDLPPTR